MAEPPQTPGAAPPGQAAAGADGPVADGDLERLAAAIAERGLAVPAVFFLELHRPLATLSSHLMVVGSPFLAALLGLERFERWRGVLADPRRYAGLLEGIERAAAVRDA